jgi:predicted amino acid-binding ACT domain protein
MSPLHRYRGVTLEVACDVRLGFVDAARVFAPQKGASAVQVELLERRLERLVQVYLDEYGLDVSTLEGAGAAGLAALLKHPERFAGRRVGLVLCGGNIDPLLLASIIERGMVRAGRLARIRVAARDTPGVLARITAVVAEAGANIDEVHHQRAFSTLSAQNVEVELVLQTRNQAHVDEVLARLAAAGFTTPAH